MLTRDDLVVAVSTGSFRHGAIAAHRRTWLRGTRTFVLSDSALPNTSLHQSGVQGSSCNGVDRFASALHRANATFAGFKWVAFVEDDVYGYIDNLLRTLSAFDPDVPYWFGPHGCDARYGDDSASCLKWKPSAVARCRNPSRQGHMLECDNRTQHLYSYGGSQGDTHCGSQMCVFSRGFLRSAVQPTALETDHATCHRCVRSQADVIMSQCLHKHFDVGPTALPGITWGMRSMNAMEQALDVFPACLARCGGAAPRCAQRCARIHGVFDTISVHMRQASRSYNKRTLEELVQQQWQAEQNASALRATMQPELRWRLCCDLVHKNLAPCQYGCVPWRPLLPRAPLCPAAPSDVAPQWHEHEPRSGEQEPMPCRCPADTGRVWRAFSSKKMMSTAARASGKGLYGLAPKAQLLR